MPESALAVEHLLLLWAARKVVDAFDNQYRHGLSVPLDTAMVGLATAIHLCREPELMAVGVSVAVSMAERDKACWEFVAERVQSVVQVIDAKAMYGLDPAVVTRIRELLMEVWDTLRYFAERRTAFVDSELLGPPPPSRGTQP